MRKAGISILNIMVLLTIGIVIAGALWYSNSMGYSEPKIQQLSFITAYQVSPVSVENARWQLVLKVENDGNVDYFLKDVFVGGVSVNVYGLIHGDSLLNRSDIATSLPLDGLVISPGSTETVYVWIGGDRYTTGTLIYVELQKPNQLELRKSVILR